MVDSRQGVAGGNRKWQTETTSQRAIGPRTLFIATLLMMIAAYISGMVGARISFASFVTNAAVPDDLKLIGGEGRVASGHAVSDEIVAAEDYLHQRAMLQLNSLKHEPKVMLAVLMMDTPKAYFQRQVLRQVFPPDTFYLRFPICRPTAATLQEPDVVPCNMVENMNEGKTKRWFEYAAKYAPKSVETIFKMDTDVLFCPTDLQNTIQGALSEHKYAFFGTFMNHAACSTGRFPHCPPQHCDHNNTFVGDCWYYMSGGCYGVSRATLDEIIETPFFIEEYPDPHHEDVMTGRWVNNTKSREKVKEVRFHYFHSKSLIHVDPPTFENYVDVYRDVLRTHKCDRDLKRFEEGIELVLGT